MHFILYKLNLNKVEFFLEIVIFLACFDFVGNDLVEMEKSKEDMSGRRAALE